MRLINVHDYSIREFYGRDVPVYVALSHTWGIEEVSYQDMQDLASARQKKGFAKIELCCKQAQLDGWGWAWVDTCCIDKTSSVELSEAVNSMFSWYERSMACYVYLSDCYGSGFRGCRWLSRGWTLQELIAPLNLIFFNHQWKRIGTKREQKHLISDITGIPTGILDHSEKLSRQPVGYRMHWACSRETTREEDMAYCLLGIFDVNMPLLYGEGGKKAFLRLQEEIVRTCDDHTLFIWDLLPNLDYFYDTILPHAIKQSEQSFYGGTFSMNDYKDEDMFANSIHGLHVGNASGPSVKTPRNWSARGVLADSPAEFASWCASEPLGMLQQESLPQVTPHGLRLSLFLKEADSRNYGPLWRYMDIVDRLGTQSLMQQHSIEARRYDDSYSTQEIHGTQWRYLPTYLAALDCTAPTTEGSGPLGGSTSAGPSNQGQGVRCAVILLVKIADFPRAQFLRAPYFCHSVPISEIKTWDLKQCYIKAHHSPRIPRPATCEVTWTQKGFGYRLAAQSWAGGLFTAFRLEATSSSKNVLYVSCGVRPEYCFLDVRTATPRLEEKEDLKNAEENQSDYGENIEYIFSIDGDTREICDYWRDQGAMGRLDWNRCRSGPGPVYEMTSEIDGQRLALILNWNGSSDDDELGVPDLVVDRYTLWLSWQRVFEQ